MTDTPSDPTGERLADYRTYRLQDEAKRRLRKFASNSLDRETL